MTKRLRRRGFLLGFVLLAFAGTALWHRRAPLPPEPLPPLTGTIDRIEVDKSQRRLTVFRGEDALRSYAIALGFSPEGTKTQHGDGRTPEGTFRVDRRNPKSRFHLSLGLDYPQPQHVAAAHALGVSPGGDIFIHGQPNLMPAALLPRAGDWTHGCIAVTNAEMEELWRITPIGTKVVIRP